MNFKPIFESERKFILESYTASHGLLLFRANRTNQAPTTVDVLFQDVRAMDARVWTDTLKIEDTDREFVDGYPSNPAEMIEFGVHVFRISGLGWEGYVVADERVSYKEGNSAPKTPTGLLGEP